MGLVNLDGEFRAALEGQREGEESVGGIANEFQKIRLGVIVHDVATDAKLGSDDLDDLPRERRAFSKRPAVDFASAPNGFPEPSVSPEGKRIAYAAGQFGWDVLEISLPEGQVRTLISGGISRTPDWAPSERWR